VTVTPGTGDLNRGPLFVRLCLFGVPLVFGMFFHGLFNLADLIIVGKLGDWALAAVNTAGIITMLPLLISTGVNNASIAVISRNFGMRNYNRANANALQAFLLLGFVAGRVRERAHLRSICWREAEYADTSAIRRSTYHSNRSRSASNNADSSPPSTSRTNKPRLF